MYRAKAKAARGGWNDVIRAENEKTATNPRSPFCWIVVEATCQNQQGDRGQAKA